jgi:hypothetical protein
MSGTTRCLGTSEREPEPEYLAHPDHFFLPAVLRIAAYLEILAYFFLLHRHGAQAMQLALVCSPMKM